jgi:NTE family protein/lysophospholipid hydrolase
MDALRTRLSEILRASIEFGRLQNDALNDLVNSVEFEFVQGGSQIIREGEPSESMFILVSGRLRVSRLTQEGKLLLYNEIRPGECIGETGMILHQLRTANVTAVRDSLLAVLTRSQFESLLTRQPSAINQAFSQVIYSQLRHTDRPHAHNRAESFAIIPICPDVDVGAFTRDLVRAFSHLGKVKHLSPQFWETQHSAHADHFNNNKTIPSGLDAFEVEYDFLIYEVDTSITEWTRAVLRQADQVVFLANAGMTKKTNTMEMAFVEEPGFDLLRKHFAVLHPANAQWAESACQWCEGRDVERVYPIRAGLAKDYERLSRFLTGRAVGVVLGGGGARGFAHLGVLRAIEEAGIPIDVLGGNSMGAIIGASYAFGVPREEIHHQILRFARGGVRIGFPMLSILSNVPYSSALRQVFGEILIESLWTPYFATACNLSQAETIVLDHGQLWRALLASNSPAGLLPPVIYNGDLLVDGAILENVPVTAMRSRLGTVLERRRNHGTVIAIDVDVRESLKAPPGLTELRPRDVLKSRLTPSAKKIPSIVDILMQAGHIGGQAQRDRTIALADYYLEPPVTHYPMMGYKKAEEIIEIGYRYAVEQIGRWGKLN